jgi:hypothetical protein
MVLPRLDVPVPVVGRGGEDRRPTAGRFGQGRWPLGGLTLRTGAARATGRR